uniref:JmjC domain-containing protein n=1 Tax=Strongyloides papillosus TaxID=174720 RepID=A0A0N5CCQ1_STREA
MPRKRKSEVQKIVKKSSEDVPPPVKDEDGALFIEGFKYDINKILNDSCYERNDLYKVVQAKELNVTYFRLNGTSTPILVDGTPQELGMTMPDKNYLTIDRIVKICGKALEIDVIKVGKFETIKMSLEEFGKHFSKPPEEREVLLNSLSQEFSYNELSKHVRAPSFVKEMDWVIKYWPDILKVNQLKYIDEKGLSLKRVPNVHCYCLISMKHSYTDFHMDFGGTSVWYHVLDGKKIFWLIPPTEENIKLHEQFMKGCKSTKEFLGETAKDCFRVTLCAGQTFLIPSGFIHAVYTAEDSIVFGGNYIHSLSIPLQLCVHRSETRSRVGEVYKYPFFNELLWYSVAGFVEEATGLVFVNPTLKKRKKQSEYDEDFFKTTLRKFVNTNKNLTECIKFVLKDEDVLKKIFNGQYFVVPDECKKFDEVRSGKTDNDSFDDGTFEQIVKRDVIDTWSEDEINGFVELHGYISKRSDKSKKLLEPVPAGITRPFSLLRAFWKVIVYAKSVKNMAQDELSRSFVDESNDLLISEVQEEDEELKRSLDSSPNEKEKSLESEKKLNDEDNVTEEIINDECNNDEESVDDVSKLEMIKEESIPGVSCNDDEQNEINLKCDEQVTGYEEIETIVKDEKTKEETLPVAVDNSDLQSSEKDFVEKTSDDVIVAPENLKEGSESDPLPDETKHDLDNKEDKKDDCQVNEASTGTEKTDNDNIITSNNELSSPRNSITPITEGNSPGTKSVTSPEENKAHGEISESQKVEENVYKPEDNVLKLGGESNSSMYRRRVSDQRKKVIPTASKTLKEKVEWQGFSGIKCSPKIPRIAPSDNYTIPEKKIKLESDISITDSTTLINTPILNHSGFLLEPKSQYKEIHKVDYPKSCTKTTADIVNKTNEVHKILEANMDHR